MTSRLPTSRSLRAFAAASLTVILAAFETGALLAQTVAKLDVNPRQVSVGVGARFEVLAIAEDRTGNILNPKFEWVAKDAAIAKVEEDPAVPGVAFVIGVGAGSTTVDVRVGNLSQTIRVTVEGARVAGPVGTGVATVLQIEPPTIHLLLAEDKQLLPRFLKNDGSPAAPLGVEWRSFRPDVATIDPTGRIVGVSAGSGLIEVTTPTGLSQRAQVHVGQLSWSFLQRAVALAPAESDTITVVVPEQNNRPVEARYFQWQSTNPNVAIVSPLGVVTAIQAGSAEIVANGFGQQSRTSVTVHKPVAEWRARAYPGDTIVIPIGGSAPFAASAYAADGTQVPEALQFWAVGDTSVAEYGTAADTLATGKKIGRTTLRVSDEKGVLREWVLSVVAAGLVFDVTRTGLSFGATMKIQASYADEAGRPLAPAATVAWVSSNPEVARVDETGVVTALNAGRATIVGTTPWNNADTAVVFVQGRLLVVSTRSGSADVMSVSTEDPSRINAVLKSPAQELEPAFSPDGTRIAFVTDRDANFEIYVADADGGNARRLTQTGAAERNPAWTADGAQIVFESDRSGVTQIWIMNADGSGARQLTQGDRRNAEPAVSSTGQIAFTSERDGNHDVYLMNLDGTNQRNFTATPEVNEMMPAWIGDTAIAFLQEPRRRNQTTRAVARMNFQRVTSVIIAERPITSYAITTAGDLVALAFAAPGATGASIERVFLIPTGAGGTPVEIARQGDRDQLSTPAFRP